MPEESSLLAMVFLLEGLPQEAEGYTQEAFQPTRIAAGQTVFEAGDPGEALYVLRTGQIRIYRTNLDGKEKVLAYLGPGEVFGEMALIDDSPRSASAKAVRDTSLLVLYRNACYGLASRYPQTAHNNLAKVLARRIRDMNFEVEALSFEEAAGRVAFALLKPHRQRYGEAYGQSWRINATHQEIARLAGTNRETAARILHDLREQSIV